MLAYLLRVYSFLEVLVYLLTEEFSFRCYFKCTYMKVYLFLTCTKKFRIRFIVRKTAYSSSLYYLNFYVHGIMKVSIF